jgi:D-alanyl-D-alanine carboxypeptidase (penicillin-binding protein 5/6)
VSRHRRSVLVVAAVVLIAAAAFLVRALTLTPPAVTVRTVQPRAVRLAGTAPRPDWPAAGQAALDVPGVGSVGASGGETPRPIASLTKVMTAYLILKRYPLSRTGRGFSLTLTAADARAEAADAAQDQSVVAVAAGEHLDERQLLEALLIPSGDNIAQILAAHAAGTVARFVAQMNRQARALGMKRTTYTDPSGFDPTTVSVAADQLQLFEQAMRIPVFRQIVAMPRVTLPVAGSVENFDPLIAEGYYGKTGSDSAAEGNLAFFTRKPVAGRRLTVVGVVLGQGLGSTTSVILDAAGEAARALVDSVVPAIRERTVLARGTRVAIASGADGARTTARTTRALRVIGWGGQTEKLAVTVGVHGRRLSSGQRIGAVRLAGGLPLATGARRSSPVRTANAVPAPGFGWRLRHVF